MPKHPDSIDGNLLKKNNRYTMRVWKGEFSHDLDEGTEVTFLGYIDKDEKDCEKFRMADLSAGNYKCRICYNGEETLLTGDRRIWLTDIGDSPGPNRVTFLKPAVTPLAP